MLNRGPAQRLQGPGKPSRQPARSSESVIDQKTRSRWRWGNTLKSKGGVQAEMAVPCSAVGNVTFVFVAKLPVGVLSTVI